MDKNTQSIIEKKINRVSEALSKNNIEPLYADSAKDVINIVEGLLNEGDVVASGGSVTLKQCGVYDMLRENSKYKYLDREAINPNEIDKLYRASFSADAYLCSANAITENGEIYNVDGNSNRIAAISYGPKMVIIIAGYNKIVKDLNQAIIRVKSISAPANTARLGCETYCYETGQCLAMKKNDDNMTAGCSSDGRICCNYLVSAYQRHKNRIKVILVAEELGY